MKMARVDAPRTSRNIGKDFKNWRVFVIGMEGRARSERLFIRGPSPSLGAVTRVRRTFWSVEDRRDWRREGLARRRGSIIGLVDVFFAGGESQSRGGDVEGNL